MYYSVRLAIVALTATVQAAAATSEKRTCWRDTPCSAPALPAFPGPWESSIYAPESRTVRPRRIISLSSKNISDYGHQPHVSLSTSDVGVVFDFGIEVGGIISVEYQLTGPINSTLGFAFTEAKNYIGRESDSSTGAHKDGAFTSQINSTSPVRYSLPDAKLRGGFRYLTLFLESESEATLKISDISLEISFQPTWSNLRAYQGYFHTSDELLEKIWCSGAYTLQTDSVPGNTGPPLSPPSGWELDQYVGPGNTVLLDGAKRDRLVWTGDMGVAVPSAFVSTGDLESTKNSLLAIYDNQLSNGVLPKAGPPYLAADSDTYQLWALIGTYNYFLYTQDEVFLEDIWPRYLKAMNNSLSKVTESGIMNVTGAADWGRYTYSNERSSASMLLYRVLRTGSELATWAPGLSGAREHSKDWTSRASKLQKAIVEQLWDNKRGAFKESPDNTDLYPQDANSMSIAFGVVASDGAGAARVSDYLVSNWTPIGPSCPELPGNISPFISSIELASHFQVGRADRALELMRNSWGWYLTHPNGTQSTMIEGYLTDGTWGYRSDRGYDNDPTYTSHSHGWSSGQTSALTEYLVGLAVTKPRGQEWQLRPTSFKEVSGAEAGFTTALGKFSAKFEVKHGQAVVEWNTPKGTHGYIALPGQKPQWVSGGKGSLKVAVR